MCEVWSYYNEITTRILSNCVVPIFGTRGNVNLFQLEGHSSINDQGYRYSEVKVVL